MLPFSETKSNKYFIREFSVDTPEEEFVWHRDQEDRIIKSLNNSNWLFQFDNNLPILLTEGKEVFIPKGVYHRVIKGNSNLFLQIEKL